jgi:hypothetical protein
MATDERHQTQKFPRTRTLLDATAAR